LYKGPGGGLYTGPNGGYMSNIPPWDVFVQQLERRKMTRVVNLLRAQGL
jgi:hypothetical protein